MPAQAPTTPDLDARERERLYADRWSGYGTHAGIAKISERPSPDVLRRYEIFQSYDDAFLEKISPDVAIASWEAGAVLFEEGSYLDVAFYVAEGSVEVFLEKHRGGDPIFDASRIHLEGLKENGASNVEQTVFFEQVERSRGRASSEITFLSTMDFDLARGAVLRLGPGEVFGEIGALNGWPQSVTARTATASTLVQIRLPALREMKKVSPAFTARLDAAYRERALAEQLRATPLLHGAAPTLLDALARHVQLLSCDPGAEVVREGTPADALYLVRSGFLKLSQRVGAGEIAVSYLSKGMTFGQVEMLIDHLDGWQQTVTSVGFSELVRIERADFLKVVHEHPPAERRLWEAAIAQIKETGGTRQTLQHADLIEFSLAEGLVQGNSILVIDLDVCTRCDDCVRGCESTHGGRPRFVREGDRYEQFLVARSCYHCEDPVCLIGCPTGAIRRANVGAVVEIDDGLCIGCSNCAQKCPYDAIIMHETGETWPETALPEWLRGRPRKVASKCDLCYTSEAGPACVNNCPHACAFRVSSLDEFQQLIDVDRAAG